MKYKLLALDIDGTIVKEHANKATKAVVDVIQEVSKLVNITLVSGRAWSDQKEIIDLLNLHGRYHVIENGAKVVNPAGRLEYFKYIPFNEVTDIATLAKTFYNDAGYCVRGKWKPYKALRRESKVSTISFISSTKRRGLQIPKILKKLSHLYSVSVGAHWENPEWSVTLISHKNASKGSGLSYIQKKLNIGKEETIAVGDGASDVSMMRYASQKIAMGNAENVLLKKANCIAPALSDNGLAYIISKFFLTP